MSEAISPPVGLAPADARIWIELQNELAFLPERVSPALRAGCAPAELIRRQAGRAAPMGRPRDGLAAAVARYERLAARIVPLPDAAYPACLRALDDAPPVLAVRGHPEVLGRDAVAIVGARAATRSARAFARSLARDLARAGLVIVSGLARGIDAEAHRGALEADGITIGVLACGVDRIYPPEHRALALQIMATGAIVSELPLGALPRPLHFPLRNRIISGLVRAVVVVEARRRSGSLITVRHALDQGREVFVVPGSVEGPFAAGTNQLLREGARAIQSARDLLDDLGFEASRTGSARASSARASGRLRGRSGVAPGAWAEGDPDAESAASTGLEAQLEAMLADGPRTADELLLESGGDPGRVATALLELELAGRIVAERDGRLHLCGEGPRRAVPGASLPCAPPSDVDRARERSKADPSDPPSRASGSDSARVPVEAAARPAAKQEIPP